MNEEVSLKKKFSWKKFFWIFFHFCLVFCVAFATYSLTLKKYTVTFSYDGKAVALTQKVKVNTVIGDVDKKTPEGYSFAGWYLEDGTKYENTKVKHDMNLTAKYSVRSYNVTFDLNGGNFVNSTFSEPLVVTYGKEADLPKAELKGKVFDHWETSTNKTIISGAKWTIASDTVLTAVYKDATTKINYELGGGTNDSKAPKVLTYGKDYDLTEYTPTKVGYVFDKWTSKEELTGTWKKEEDSICVTANWIAKKYNVYYYDKVGALADTKEDIVFDAEFEKVNPSIVTGYDFAGWEDAEGNIYTLDTTWNIDSNKVDEDENYKIELTAKYDAKTTTISFDTDGGNAIANTIATYDSEFVMPSDPIKTGYTFDGWYNGATKVEAGDAWKCADAELTLKAQWIAQQTTIIFDSNGGSAVDNITIKYDEKFDLPDDPNRDDYTFDGWFIGSTKVEAITKWNKVYSEITYTAKWHKTKSEVTFSNEGINIEFENKLSSVMSDNKKVDLNYGEKLGEAMPSFNANYDDGNGIIYEFDGWYDKKGNQWTKDTISNIEEDIILTSKWIIKSYTFNNADDFNVTKNYFVSIAIIKKLINVEEITLPDGIDEELLDDLYILIGKSMPKLTKITKGSTIYNVRVESKNIIFEK